MARENYQSYSRETGSEPKWRMRSSGPQKLRSSVKTKLPGQTSSTLVVEDFEGIVGILERSLHPLIMTHQGTTPKFRISTVSLLPRLSRWRIPTFLKAATQVFTQEIRPRFQNREPQVVDLLGNPFVMERTFSIVDFVNCGQSLLSLP